MRIRPEEAIAIVVDYQEKLIPVIHEQETVVQHTKILLEGLKELEVPMIISQQYTKGLGETIAPIREVVGEEKAFEKTTFSLWQTEDIRRAITETGRKKVILCGVEAHICVLQTAIDLLAEEYQVYLVQDCIGSRKPNDKKFACKRAMQEGAFLTTYEAMLYELTIGAKNPHFKAISELTK